MGIEIEVVIEEKVEDEAQAEVAAKIGIERQRLRLRWTL